MRLLSVGVVLLACSCMREGSDCAERACERLSIAGHALSDSLRIDGTVCSPVASSTVSDVPDGHCYATLQSTSSETPRLGVPAQMIAFRCRVGGKILSMGVDVPDLRDAKVGETRNVDVGGWTQTDGSGSECYLDPPDLALVVTEHVGGSAPYPALVTSDYAVSASITIEAISSCATVSGTAHVRVTAGDFHLDPDARCRTCLE